MDSQRRPGGMQAGVIGLVDGAFDVVDDYAETVARGDRELRRRLSTDRVFSTPAGRMAFAGRAAGEFPDDGDRAVIEDGEIRLRERPGIETRFAEVVGVPGEIVVADSGDGAFAFDLVGAETGTAVDRAALDLDALYERLDGRPWKAGFRGTGEEPVSGVFHGTDLRRSHDLDVRLADATLNQLGLVHDRDGAEVKVTAAASGYVEMYRPADFGAGEYLDYLLDEVRPHLS